jgi:DNA polymerase-3 subunit delta
LAGVDNRPVVEPLFLVHGDDPYLVTNMAVGLRAQLTSELVSDLGLEEFRSSRDLDAIARSLATPPFLAIRRLVMVWDPPQLPGRTRSTKKVGQPATEVAQLATVLASRLETTAVVVVVRALLGDGSSLVRAVKSQGGEVRSLRRPKGRELQRYVESRISERRLHLGRAVVARLVDIARQHLGQLDQELEKLELFASGAGQVSDSDALLLVPPSPPTELYHLTNSLFEAPGQVGERLDELSRRPDVQPPMVVGALARVFRELISFADPRDCDRWRDLAPWSEQRLRSHLERSGEPRLRRWLVQLAQLDWSTRTGAIDAQEGLDLLLAGMAAEIRGPVEG